ncbi:MAG: superoxide dismutase [Fe] [candidate division Zixibacteria bacterium CG_4_9_14_3_um_filter_46_8]|nr:MAG: superoxide dismutase [Fe] [candidate division Zixibacteria bacterium CG_4_9_14_3_um_filter_46_8]
MPITHIDLPYLHNALEPYMSAKTFEFHHGKHLKAYVDNGNKLIAGTNLENADLDTIVKEAAKDPSKAGIFNNAAQVWNHNFFFKCMKSNGGGVPSGKIAEMINASFGGYQKFADEFKNAGLTQFGSGWAWLVLDGNQVKIMKTANADNPVAHGLKPLLGVDVWEHSYYLDYQNRRADYLTAFVDKLINWDFVNSLLG